LKIMKRRNFKALERPALLQALDAWPWADVYGIRDPDRALRHEGDHQRLGPGRPREVNHGQRGVAPCLPASRYARPDGQEGLPRPRHPVQSDQEQGHRDGQEGQGGLEPGQDRGVGQLPRGAMGDSERSSRQASPASANVAYEGGWHADGGKPRNCKHHQRLLHAESVADSGWEGSPKH
jgi:hypothetical protein